VRRNTLRLYIALWLFWNGVCGLLFCSLASLSPCLLEVKIFGFACFFVGKVVSLYSELVNNTAMALETRPFPVLTGRAARDFLEKVENFKTSETRIHIRECNRKYGKMIEDARLRERKFAL